MRSLAFVRTSACRGVRAEARATPDPGVALRTRWLSPGLGTSWDVKLLRCYDDEPHLAPLFKPEEPAIRCLREKELNHVQICHPDNATLPGSKLSPQGAISVAVFVHPTSPRPRPAEGVHSERFNRAAFGHAS